MKEKTKKLDEYINRKEALALVKPDTPEDEKAAITIATAKKLIRSILHRTPSADVAPMQHGRWLYHTLIDEHIHAECSECHKVRIIDNFCPNCGAKMDGGAD